MHSFIPLLIFLFHFIKYINGFEYSDEVGCDSFNSQEIIYTHNWLIKDFQDLYNRLGYEKKFFSEKFFTPTLNDNQRDYYSWRVIIYPHVSSERKKRDQCMGIYLTAFKTDYEELNELDSRETSYNIEIYLNNDNIDHDISDMLLNRGSLKFLAQGEIQNKIFLLTQNVNAYGYIFCIIPNIFPIGDTSIRTNLIIRVNFYDKNENITGSMPKMNQQNFFDFFDQPEFEQYFNNKKFSDTIFKFNCESEIWASSIFLASRYSHFKKLLSEVQKDSQQLFIHHVDGASYNCFYKLLRFVYTGKLDNNLTYAELLELYHESNSREIHDLKEIISCRILKFMNETTWDELLLLGWETKNNFIKNAVIKFINDNWTEVEDTDKMKSIKIKSLKNMKWLEELIVTKIFGGLQSTHAKSKRV